MVYDKDKFYDDLPLLPPKTDVETRGILKKCVSATKYLSELKGIGDLIPNQSILINAIPLQEAQFSSEIENIVTTTDALFRDAMTDESKIKDPAVKEVLRYRTALRFGYKELTENKKTIDTKFIEEVCSQLLGKEMHLRSKNENVHLVGNMGIVHYTPPRGGNVVQEMLSNLLNYLDDKEDVETLIKIAIAHYQFEAIHPFSDGNGRTGRILNILLLVQMGILKLPVLYLSRYIINNKTQYYELLDNVTKTGDWVKWITYFLTGIEEMAKWTLEKIRAIKNIMDETMDYCKEKLPRIYSKDLIELVFTYPYCRIKYLVDNKIAKRVTASEYLKQLENIGILDSQMFGRDLIYINTKLLDLLVH